MFRPRPLLARVTFLALLGVAATSTGCAQQRAASMRPTEEYSRPLPPGASALRRVDPERLPDLGAAYRRRDPALVTALDASLDWFRAPSSRNFFPFEGITHERANASLRALRTHLGSASSEADFVARVRRDFDVYESVGYNGEGVVLFTGYYAPIFNASRTRTGQYRHPLYRRPADLLTDPVTGAPQGRRTASGQRTPYPTRAEIEDGRLLAGRELVWLEDALSAYLVHVNGSARLRMRDGSTMNIGYAGKTDRPYASLGRAMIDAGLLAADEVSLPAIRRVYERDPRAVERLMRRNESYVFFTEVDAGSWPAGSLGVPVTGRRSLATDKKIFPRGGLVLVDTNTIKVGGGTQKFLQFMLDQDTGGAIRAPGRADIFMGVGRGAEVLAGGQYAEGKMYYFFVRPELVAAY
ncbi:MAG: murein transglycosylase [Phycisphaerales bacterium]|nr:murein transglycosylase [Phycisphaerales bacterium]